MKHVAEKTKDFHILVTITAEQKVRFKIVASCGDESQVAQLVRAVHEKRPQKMEDFHKLALKYIGCQNCVQVIGENTRMPDKEPDVPDEARKWFSDPRNNINGGTHCYALIDVTAAWAEIAQGTGDKGRPFSASEINRGVHNEYRGEVEEYKQSRGQK